MPPAIVAAVVAVGASAAGAFGVISLSTAMIIATTATVAGALLTKQSIPSLGNYTPQAERKQVLRSSAAPCTYIYGKTVVSGTLFFAEEQAGDQDDGEWVHLALVIADHPIHKISKIWLGDDLIETYGSHATYEVHIDRKTADPFMLKNCRSWKSSMIGRGITWLRVSLKFSQEVFPAGLPNIKCEVYGALVTDPRTGLKAWTDNAALIIRDVYLSPLMNVPLSDLDDNYFKQSANICDEMVTNSDGSLEKRYTINGVFDASEAIVSILDDMHEACGGEPTFSGGKHGLLVGAYYGPAIYDLTDDHIISDVNIVPETQYSDKVNVISGTFIDPKQGYVEADFPPIVMQDWVEEDGAEFKQDLKLRFVTSEFTAQRLANIILNRKKLGRTIELTANFHAYRFRTGFYVRLTVKDLGINRQEFRVVGWEMSGATGVKLTLRQETAALWVDAVGKPLERPDLVDLPKGNVVPPTSLEYVTESVGDVVQGYLRWSNSGNISYNAVQIFDSDGALVFNVNVPSNKVNLNGLKSGVYTAQVVAYGVSGGKSAPAVAQIDVRAPSAPTSIRLESGFYSIGIYPTSANSQPVTFEFWFSETELSDQDITKKGSKLGSGDFWIKDGANPVITYHFYVRAVSIYGVSGFARISGRASDKADEILDIIGERWRDSEIGKEIEDIKNDYGDILANNKALEDVIQQNKDDLEKLNIAVRKSFQSIGDVTFEIRQNKGTNEAEIKRVEGVIATETEARAQSFEYLNAKIEGVNGTLTGELNTFKDVYVTDKAALVTWQQEAVTRFEHNESSILEIQETTTTLTESVAQNTRQLTAQQSTINSHGEAISEHTSRITNVEKVSANNTQAITENKQSADSRFARNEASLNQVQQTAASAEDAAVKFAVQMAAESKKTQENVNESKAEILGVKNAIADQDRAVAQQISQLKTEFNSNIATINGELKVVSDATSANASAIQILATDVGNNKGQISSIQTSITTLEKSTQETKDLLYAQTQSTDERFTAVNKTINQTKTDLEKSIASSNQSLSSQIALVDGKAVQAGKDAATANSNAGKAQTAADNASKSINDYKTANDKEIVLVKADIATNKQAIATEKQARTTDITNLQSSLDNTNAKVEQKMEAVVEHNGTVAATYTLRAGIELPNGTYKSAGLFIGVSGGANPVASVGVSADNFVVMNNRNGKLEAVFQVDPNGNVVIRNALISKLFVEEAIVGSTLSSADFSATKGIQIDFKNGKIIANGGTWGAGLNVGNPTGKGLSITDQTILVRDENGRLRFACGYIKGLV